MTSRLTFNKTNTVDVHIDVSGSSLPPGGAPEFNLWVTPGGPTSAQTWPTLFNRCWYGRLWLHGSFRAWLFAISFFHALLFSPQVPVVQLRFRCARRDRHKLTKVRWARPRRTAQGALDWDFRHITWFTSLVCNVSTTHSLLLSTFTGTLFTCYKLSWFQSCSGYVCRQSSQSIAPCAVRQMPINVHKYTQTYMSIHKYTQTYINVHKYTQTVHKRT